MYKTFALLPIFILLLTAQGLAAQPPSFAAAKPVWLEGRELEMNVSAGFRAVFDRPEAQPVTLRVTGSCIYRIFVNGEFAGHGPARGPHGWYRVDEWDITSRLRPGSNVVAIEVAGYNCNSYYLLDQPSFLQAEILAGGSKVLAATGSSEAPFPAKALAERVQKVERFSFQRPFAEAYALTPGYDAWRSAPDAAFQAETCAPVEAKQLLPRRVAYPTFEVKPALTLVAAGAVKLREGDIKFGKGRQITGIAPDLKGYPEAELTILASVELQKYENAELKPAGTALAAGQAQSLGQHGFIVADFGVNYTGFLGASVSCKEPTTLYMAFDEVLNGAGDVDARRMGCANIVAYDLQPGDYHLESIEPYTLRYAKFIVLKGACDISAMYIREYVNPEAQRATFNAADERLNRLFEAGVETFAQNAVDVFMDCPSRERAGWLCDSFFTSRTAKDLCGNTLVEKNFIENFLLPPSFAHLPEGMLPMCYPSDHYNGNFIPNWAMWFVVELEEYLARSGDREMVDALKPKVLKLLEYFDRFENEDGLLEKLEAWVFVEWSEANKFVQDVNYPSNMLYAGTLAATGRMYGMPELVEKAEGIRETIRKQSFDGEFFVDNAMRKEGKLEVTRNRSEVCQYFAFFFDIATPETNAELWKRLQDAFGPDRKETKAFGEVHMANSFIGNMLRMELLSQNARCQQILDESIGYLLYMAERTGTLWENVHAGASCNHGFASHICHTLFRDILGVYKLDYANKRIQLRFTDLELGQCEGTIPTPDGPVALSWKVNGGRLTYNLTTPAGYTVDVENLSTKELVKAAS